MDLQTETEYCCWAEVIRLEQIKKYTAESEFRVAQKSKIQFLQWLPTRILKHDSLEEVGKVNGR